MSYSIDTIITAEVSDEQSKLSREAASNVWKDIASTTQGLIPEDVDRWMQHIIDPVRSSWMEMNHGSNQDAKKKKDGSWKYRTYMPPAFNTALAVAHKGLRAGITNMEGKGKTAVEQEYKDRSKIQKTEMEKFDCMIKNCRKQFENLTQTEKENAVFEYDIMWK